MSLRQYAIRRGVSVESVSKAVSVGRLHSSVVFVGGQPKIGDPELADQEWADNTKARPNEAPPSSDPDVPNYNTSRALREAAAARREAALADMAEIEVAEKRGELVDADDARAEMIDRFTVVKTRILGVPSRLAQRMPGVGAEAIAVVEELLREALEELALDE